MRWVALVAAWEAYRADWADNSDTRSACCPVAKRASRLGNSPRQLRTFEDDGDWTMGATFELLGVPVI